MSKTHVHFLPEVQHLPPMPKGNQAKAAKLRAEASRLERDANHAYEPWRKYSMRGEAMHLRRQASELDPPAPPDKAPIVITRPRMTKEERLQWNEDQEMQREAQYLNSPGAHLGGHH